MNTSVIVAALALLRQRLGHTPLFALSGVVAAIALTLSAPALVRRFPMPPDAKPGELQTIVTNLRYLYLSGLTEILGRTLTTCAFVLVALCVGRSVDPALLNGFGPVIHQPRWLMLIEMLVLYDLVYYWTHRMAHSVPFLWRFHAIHHSTLHMSFIAAARVHPLESYAVALNTLPLFALGFPVDALLPLLPFTAGYAMLIHSNLRFNPRRFAYLINSPAFHHWHHARKFRGNGTNFAGYFPIFDRLFGSYYLPNESPQEVGVDAPNMPQTYQDQLLYPFLPTREPADTHATGRSKPAQ
jgi:sterol desaturase/sphingolipid hydroxylase (fatty acid hydroxylase superfamily)